MAKIFVMKFYSFSFHSWVYDPFGVNFLYGVSVEAHVFPYGCPVIPAPFVGKTLLSLLKYLGSFAKKQLTIWVWSIFDSLFCSTDIYMFILTQLPQCLDYCSFVVSLFFFKYKSLLIYFWLLWVFIAARGLSLAAASGGYSLLWCVGFSMQWLLLLRSTGSRRMSFSSCGSWALERRLSSCGPRA